MSMYMEKVVLADMITVMSTITSIITNTVRLAPADMTTVTNTIMNTNTNITTTTRTKSRAHIADTIITTMKTGTAVADIITMPNIRMAMSTASAHGCSTAAAL